MSTAVGTVAELWQYPVKSAQGRRVDTLTANEHGFEGDRAVGFVNTETGKLLSAKRYPPLLTAVGHADRLELDDGRVLAFDDPATPAAVGEWLGTSVALARSGTGDQVTYEMNFGPLDDPSAPTIDIPVPRSTLFDLGAAHLITRATLDHAAASAPELDWDVRRFRPNIVVDTGAGEPFTEDTWVGKQVQVGGVTFGVMMSTIRCAMPMRAQAGGEGEPLDAQPEMFGALNAVHGNYLGVYLNVEETGAVSVGDAVTVLA